MVWYGMVWCVGYVGYGLERGKGRERGGKGEGREGKGGRQCVGMCLEGRSTALLGWEGKVRDLVGKVRELDGMG